MSGRLITRGFALDLLGAHTHPASGRIYHGSVILEMLDKAGILVTLDDSTIVRLETGSWGPDQRDALLALAPFVKSGSALEWQDETERIRITYRRGRAMLSREIV